MMIPVSIGELLDKISILELKMERISDTAKILNVERELQALTEAARDVRMPDLEAELHDVNSKLWDVEDALRDCERSQTFGNEFIFLARAVYKLNDQRAEIKRAINMILGSHLMEEKSYG